LKTQEGTKKSVKDAPPAPKSGEIGTFVLGKRFREGREIGGAAGTNESRREGSRAPRQPEHE